MKINLFILKILAIALIFSSSACQNLFNDDDDEPQLEYLVNYEIKRSYLPVMVETIFNQVVTAYPEMAAVQERVKYGLVVYSITYRTTFEGEPVIASGLVSAPMGEGPFPILSYQNGTNTLHNNAPSVNPDRDFYIFLETVASTGFVIALPDYIGFGSTDDTFHPYLHQNSTVPVVIDMLRAVEELASLRDFRLNNDLYLTGYSMGGWATLQVQKEIETNHSSEFNLKASAPSAGPYDLSFVNNYILDQETYINPYFMGFVFESYNQLNEIHTPLDAIFNPPYDSLVAVLYDGNLSGEAINSQLTTDISELFTENFLMNYDTDTTFSSIREALEANSVDAWNVSTPTRLIHSTGDESVPFQVSQSIYQQLLNEGTSTNTVQLVPLPDFSHDDGIIPAGLFTIQWFLEIQEE